MSCEEKGSAMTDLTALREAAEKATPGPWRALTSGVIGGDHWYVCDPGEMVAYVAANDGSDEGQRQSNAEYIAAAHPSAVLALLDEIDVLRRQRDDTATARDALRRQRDKAEKIVSERGEALDALEAATGVALTHAGGVTTEQTPAQLALIKIRDVAASVVALDERIERTHHQDCWLVHRSCLAATISLIAELALAEEGIQP